MAVNTPDDLEINQAYFISNPPDKFELLGVYEGSGRRFKNGKFRWSEQIQSSEKKLPPLEYSFYNMFNGSTTYTFDTLLKYGSIITKEEYKLKFEQLNPRRELTFIIENGVYKGYTNSPKQDYKGEGGKFKKSIRRNVKKRRTQQKNTKIFYR